MIVRAPTAGPGSVAISVHDPLPQLPALPELPDPPQIEIPKPPGTKLCCGRVSCGSIDYIAGAIEVIATSGTAYSAYAGMKLAAGLFGTVGGLCLVVHIIYRKYGDLYSVEKKLNLDQQKYHELLNEQIRLIQQWIEIVGGIQALNQQLQIENSQFQANNNQLQQTVVKLNQDLAQLQQTNADISKVNASLRDQVKNLGEVNISIQTRVQDFNRQLSGFNTAIQSADHLIPQINATDKALDRSVDNLDHRFDEDLVEFSKQINALKQNLQSLFVQIQKEKNDLEAQVAQLAGETTQLREAVGQFDAERQKYASLEEAYSQVSAQLSQLQAAGAPELAALRQERDQLASLVNTLQRGQSAIASGAAPLAHSLDQFQHNLDATLARQEADQRAIQDQMARLGLGAPIQDKPADQS